MNKKRETITFNRINKETKLSLKVRIISSIIALAIAIPCILFGDWLFALLVLFFVFVATYEIIRCAKPKHSVWLYIVSVILIICLTFWPLLRQLTSKLDHEGWHIYGGFNSIYLSIFIVVVAFFALFWLVVADANFSVRDACFVFAIGIVVGLGFQSMLYLRYIPLYEKFVLLNEPDNNYFSLFKNFESSSLAVYVAIATFMTDIGAYFVGVFFGKNKINPRISPKKTWEGFFGGIIISTIFSFCFAFFLALGGHPVLQKLDVENWYFILSLSLLIPLFSTLGDFTFSSLKRYYEIKDFGKLIPGHGGVLDRVDSLIFSAIFSSIFICFILSVTYSYPGGNPLF